MIKHKLAIILTHPIQYYSPWFVYLQSLVESKFIKEKFGVEFEFEVFYGMQSTPFDQSKAGFGVEFEWDIPLLNGYPYRFLENKSKKPSLNKFYGVSYPFFKSILKNENFTDVLLIGWHKLYFWQAFFVAKYLGLRVFSRGDSQVGITKSLPKKLGKLCLYRFLLPRFDGHLYVGQRNKAYLMSYGVDQKKLFFCPHFVDNEFWRQKSQFARSLLKKDDNKSVRFLYAGKFIQKKRVSDLLEALALVPEAFLVLVGDGPLRNSLEKRANHNDIRGRVFFAGFKNQSQLPEVLVETDCLVLPSDGSETWGLIVNEAMACGLPAIVGNECGCCPDLIDDGLTGYSYNTGDIIGLACTLKKFIDQRKQSWVENLNRKMQKYSIETATSGLFECLFKK